MKRTVTRVVFGLFALSALAGAAPAVHCQVCPSIPVPAVAGTEKVCEADYISFYDAKLKVPRLIVYELTGPHTLGCLPRLSGFHPEGDSAKPSAYAGTGMDLGHQKADQDSAWSKTALYDSFSMVNVAPQLPGLNRQDWERLEELVRAWALERGDLRVYVGPVLSKHPKFVNGVAIPIAFFKIIQNEKTGEVISFEMPQLAIPKGDVTKYIDQVAAIASETGINFSSLHLKLTADKPWPADIAAWHRAHKQACGQ